MKSVWLGMDCQDEVSRSAGAGRTRSRLPLRARELARHRAERRQHATWRRRAAR